MRIIYYFYRGSLTVAIFLSERQGPLTGAEWVVYSRGSVLERCAKQFVWFLCRVGMIVFRVARELGHLFEWMLIAGYSFDS